MVRLETDAVDGVPVLSLRHPDGAEAVFAPTLGARLLRLRLVAGGQPYTLVDTGLTSSDLANVRSQSAILAPWPNRIAGGQYTWQGQAFQLAITEPARGNALHGLVHDRPWVRVSDPAGTVDEGIIAFEHAYNGATQGYPFAFRIRVLYHLQADHLAVTWLVRNEGHQPMPLGLGWHPYFQLNGSLGNLQLRIPATHQAELNQAMIPTGWQPYDGPFRLLTPIGDATFDDCFRLAAEGDHGGDGVAEILLHHPALNRTLLVIQPVGAFPFVQIYTPPHRRTIAIEPMTCPPDVYNQPEHLIPLAEGDTWRASCRLELH